MPSTAGYNETETKSPGPSIPDISQYLKFQAILELFGNRGSLQNVQGHRVNRANRVEPDHARTLILILNLTGGVGVRLKVGINIEKSGGVGSGRGCPPQLGVWGFAPEKKSILR